MRLSALLAVIAFSMTGVACKRVTSNATVKDDASTADCSGLEKQLAEAEDALKKATAAEQHQHDCSMSAGTWDGTKSCCTSSLTLPPEVPSCAAVTAADKVKDDKDHCSGYAGTWNDAKACCSTTITLPPEMPSCAAVAETDKAKQDKDQCLGYAGSWKDADKCCETKVTLPPEIAACKKSGLLDNDMASQQCKSNAGAWDTAKTCCNSPITLPPEVPACTEGGGLGLVDEASIHLKSVAPTAPRADYAGLGLGDAANATTALSAKVEDLKKQVTACKTPEQSGVAATEKSGTVASTASTARGACVVSAPGNANECAENHSPATCDDWAKSKTPLGSFKGTVTGGKTCAEVAATSTTGILSACRLDTKAGAATSYCHNLTKKSDCDAWVADNSDNYKLGSFTPGTTCIYKDGTPAETLGACSVTAKPGDAKAYCDSLDANGCTTWGTALKGKGLLGTTFVKGARCKAGMYSTYTGKVYH